MLTPQGQIIVLPAHATAVDFAYTLHTNIGHRCTGVKIDKEFALLTQKLESGQTIEIVTGKEDKPCADWLNFVATHKARQSIRQYLKQLPKEQSIPEGRRLLKLALNQTNLTDISQQNIDKVLEDYHLTDFNGLLHEIGTGKLLSILIARRLRGNAGELTESVLKQQTRQSAIKEH